VEWLRGWNAARDASAQAGFYGIDLYSLHGSIEAVLRYLEQVDPPAAERARARYACFGHAGEDPQAYGYVASYDLTQSCEDEVVRQLVELQRCASEYAGTGPGAQEDFFSAERNAQLVANAEQYYRSMFRGRVSSWNLRDTHMADTLDAVIEHLGREGGEAKVVVWAHNSHLGDARATEMGRGGELNVGQLVRERWGGGARLVGFTTHTGTVTAAHDWDEPASRKAVRPSLAHSYERLLHDTGLPAFALDLRRTTEATEGLRVERLERAIGVIYRPETERMSHYFHAELPRQFDFVIHLDVTRALPPLEPGDRWHAGAEEPPETYPSAL